MLLQHCFHLIRHNKYYFRCKILCILFHQMEQCTCIQLSFHFPHENIKLQIQLYFPFLLMLILQKDGTQTCKCQQIQQLQHISQCCITYIFDDDQSIMSTKCNLSIQKKHHMLHNCKHQHHSKFDIGLDYAILMIRNLNFQ